MQRGRGRRARARRPRRRAPAGVARRRIARRVTIADLLEHASGLTAYLPFFRDHHGRAEFERAICTLPLEYAPRTQSIYSDLGFILLAFILEDVNHAPFAKQFDRSRSAQMADDRVAAVQPAAGMRERCAPTELDLWRGRLLQGEVHDENCVGARRRGRARGTLRHRGERRRVRARRSSTTTGPVGGRSAKPETLARFVARSRTCPAARARSGGTRCSPPRRAARACRRARSATPDSPARRCGSIPSRISTSSCSPTACIRRATTIGSSRCGARVHDASRRVGSSSQLAVAVRSWRFTVLPIASTANRRLPTANC